MFMLIIMSNPDIGNQGTTKNNSSDDFPIKNNICLFKLSKLKSKIKIVLSQNNSFNYDLSKIDQNELQNTFNEGDNIRYIKKVNIEIPSSKKLLKKDFKNEFINNYDDSFASFCGLKKEQFIEIYINNQYIPILNELGNINISIKSIIDILKTYSFSKKLKTTRRVRKRNQIKKKNQNQKINLAQNKYKKLFRVIQIDKNKEIIDSKKENIDDSNNSNNSNNNYNTNLNNDKDNEDKNDLKNNKQNNISDEQINENNENNENSEKTNDNLDNKNKKGKTLLNIKKNLKNISIPKTDNKESSSFGEKNIIINQNLNSNNNIINNESKKILSASNIQSNLLNQSSHMNALQSCNSKFNFSLNKTENEIHYKQTLTPFITNNNNNNALNTSLNNNINSTPFKRPILSPINITESIGNILSPNYYHYPKNNMLSPFLGNDYPFNNNIFNDHFVFNNMNTNSFFFDNNENNNEENINNNDNYKDNIDDNNYNNNLDNKNNDDNKKNDIN